MLAYNHQYFYHFFVENDPRTVYTKSKKIKYLPKDTE